MLVTLLSKKAVSCYLSAFLKYQRDLSIACMILFHNFIIYSTRILSVETDGIQLKSSHNSREKLKLWLFLPYIQMDRGLEHVKYEEQLQDIR